PAPPGGWSTDWATDAGAIARTRATLAARFTAEGLRLEGLDLEPGRATVRFTNLRHEAQPRALGRAARILSAVLPPSVEEIVLLPAVRGLAVSAVTLRRSDLEELEHDPDGADALRARTAIDDAAASLGPQPLLIAHPADAPRLGWSVLPYLAPTIMDPSSPVRLEAGLRAEARFALASNLLVSGALTQRVAGNLGGTTRAPEACRSDGFCYERVRSDATSYVSDSPVLERLTMAHFSRPGANLYGRLSAGWLERMYAGVSAEVLWKPAAGPLALGAEVNRVRRRAPSSFGGLLDYEVTTGHVSAYVDFGAGYVGQIDVGQYLAGDRGATLSLSREFASGWRLGAYATLTDMPFSAFGEGSFDKGITITIPVTWFDGRPSRARSSQTIRSLQRDGGARLDVANRLYPMVRDLHRAALDDSWGTVWQ
ncbi:YjbH domain-containing protein, partial [Rhodobaculum claviforme]